MQNIKLTFVNVGYGEAILLECPAPALPHGRFTLLIDGGSAEPAEYADRSTGRIPLTEYLAGRDLQAIDLLVSTHIHEDHLCGLLPVANLLPVRTLWQGLPAGFHRRMETLDETLADTDSQRKFLRALNDHQALCKQVEAGGGEIFAASAGDTLTPCAGLRIRVLAPGPARLAELAVLCGALYTAPTGEEQKRRLLRLDAEMNNFSLILLVEYRGTRLLLPGDTNCLGYGEIAPEDLRADLFKMGHHGQGDSITAELLQSIRPAVAVCCASSDRRYNSADAGVLRLLRESGARLYFSDCPRVDGLSDDLQPHRALEFSVGEQGALTARYLSE